MSLIGPITHPSTHLLIIHSSTHLLTSPYSYSHSNLCLSIQSFTHLSTIHSSVISHTYSFPIHSPIQLSIFTHPSIHPFIYPPGYPSVNSYILPPSVLFTIHPFIHHTATLYPSIKLLALSYIDQYIFPVLIHQPSTHLSICQYIYPLCIHFSIHPFIRACVPSSQAY